MTGDERHGWKFKKNVSPTKKVPVLGGIWKEQTVQREGDKQQLKSRQKPGNGGELGEVCSSGGSRERGGGKRVRIKTVSTDSQGRRNFPSEGGPCCQKKGL